MHVVLYHHARLPVRRYGGTERVVVWLARALAQLGHQATLLAGRGSRVAGVKVVEIEHGEVAAPGFDVRRYVEQPVDLIHYHIPVRFPPKLPYVWTLHGNRPPGAPLEPFAICVSADHARRHGTTAFVHNGVDLEEYAYRADKEDYDLFLARLHGAKGWRLAVAAAKRCRVRLLVAGGWRPTLSRFVRFLGEVDTEKKRTLLAGARCLWAPVQWAEPFGLNVVEALASGTPIIGSPGGALPELVTPEVGGLGRDLDELIALRRRLAEWEPAACRKRAERCFTHLRMGRDYLRMYEHVLQHGGLPGGRRADDD